jgi:UDPglucose 6-dehydrogenase
MNIGLIGYGFVGKATKILDCDNVNFFVYDINPDLCDPKDTTLEKVSNCDLVFIAVPTPLDNNNNCHTNIVESVVNSLRNINSDCKIVIRSTVPPGTSKRLNCGFMPEYLTEKNFMNDFINATEWTIGSNDPILIKRFTELINYSYNSNKIKSNKIYVVESDTAETVKYTKNTFLALKVSFFNEIYDFCEKKNINFDYVRELVTIDTRIGSSHSNCPGHDGKRGYGGTCLPKDSKSFLSEFEKNNVPSYLIKSCVERNDNLDRVDGDWQNDKGRSTI